MEILSGTSSDSMAVGKRERTAAWIRSSSCFMLSVAVGAGGTALPLLYDPQGSTANQGSVSLPLPAFAEHKVNVLAEPTEATGGSLPPSPTCLCFDTTTSRGPCEKSTEEEGQQSEESTWFLCQELAE